MGKHLWFGLSCSYGVTRYRVKFHPVTCNRKQPDLWQSGLFWADISVLSDRADELIDHYIKIGIEVRRAGGCRSVFRIWLVAQNEFQLAVSGGSRTHLGR